MGFFVHTKNQEAVLISAARQIDCSNFRKLNTDRQSDLGFCLLCELIKEERVEVVAAHVPGRVNHQDLLLNSLLGMDEVKVEGIDVMLGFDVVEVV